MLRDGAITFADLIGKLAMLRVAWDKCGRDGCYGLNRLIERRGRDAKLFDWLDLEIILIPGWNVAQLERHAPPRGDNVRTRKNGTRRPAPSRSRWLSIQAGHHKGGTDLGSCPAVSRAAPPS